MAKNGEGGKIRGFFFEIDGDNETLQEGLRNFGAALGRALSGPSRPQPKALNGPKRNTPALADETEVEEEATEASEDGDEFTVETPKPPKKPGTRKAAAMPSVIKVDLDSADVTFKAFAEKKKPDSIADKVMVVVAWFNNYGGVTDVTADHAFTCFKYMEWTPHPKNYNQVFLDLKRKQHKLEPGATAGTYKLNIVGQNAIDKMGA